MIRATQLLRFLSAALRRARDDSGATLVEFAITLALFLLLFFALIDFGRLGFSYVLAQKATHNAARIAVVRPPVCAGVPTMNQRPTGGTATFGTMCRDGTSVCTSPGPFQCLGVDTNATANEIWTRIAGLMPAGATVANLRFTYATDPTLGFLGGPYVPIVTVEVVNFEFQFVSPLGALANMAGAANAQGLGENINFPSMSVSMPAEDLAHGTGG